MAPSRSTVVSSVTLAGGTSGGSTAMATDDVVGEASARMRLVDARTVEVRRDASTAAASFAWQAVTWGGPPWADLESPFRSRIDVTAGAVSTPDGYTTSFELDHAALVADGFSLADGSDVRVWRHDGTNWTELDRVVDDASAWDRSDTMVWFRTREPIASGQTATYWLYFGDPTPPPPHADPAGVWIVSEGFDDGTLGAFEDRTAGTGWYRALPWTRRIALTIPAGRTPAPLVDEPVLVRLTSADVAAHAQPDGSDLRFTAGDGVTQLAHQLEDYDTATGTVTAWVRVPVVAAASTTTLYLAYGATDAPSQSDARSTWIDGAATWQLDADTAGPAPTLDDDGPGQHDGVALADAGQVDTPTGPAMTLDGTLDRLESAPFVVADDALGVSAWVRPDVVGGDRVLVAQGDPQSTGSFELALSGSTPRIRLRLDGQVTELAGGSVPAGGWHHVAATWDGATVRLFVDGSSVGSAAAVGSMAADGPAPVVIGADPSGARAFDGTVGQIRLAPSAWSTAQVAFRAVNLLQPSTTVQAGAASGGTWFDQGAWGARYPLAIESDLVAGPLTDHPVLVQLTDPALASDAQSDGDDIVITAADGVTRLDHQIESWNPLTGALTAWVRVPTLSDATDTVLYLYLANPTAVDQQDLIGVWGADADLVVTG